ncbi:hypothetical protein GIB67_029153, partial [Kingdonia uniflora]
FDQVRAADPEEAEALAALRGRLEAARHLGLQRILLLSDCQRIVRAFRERPEDLSWGALTIAPDLRVVFLDFRFEHINRRWNFIAHHLVARGVGSPLSCIFEAYEANVFVNAIPPPSFSDESKPVEALKTALEGSSPKTKDERYKCVTSDSNSCKWVTFCDVLEFLGEDYRVIPLGALLLPSGGYSDAEVKGKRVSPIENGTKMRIKA